jgi:hypothetical protein
MGVLAALATAASTGAPERAGAHGATAHDLTPAQERELQQREAAVIGPSHAAEHAAQRRAVAEAEEEWAGLSAAERSAVAAEERGDQRALAEAAGPPAQDGDWTEDPFPIPNFAIHSVMLVTGKVLFWGYPPFGPGDIRPNSGRAALWDPSLGTGPGAFEEVPPPMMDADGDGDLERAPLYCSGQSILPSGEVLVTGGNVVWPAEPGDDYEDYAGLKTAFTFDPYTETWTEQPSMRHGRWYPTQVELADGRTVIVSGEREEAPGGETNTELEVFTPSPTRGGIGSMSYHPSGDRLIPLYPHAFTLPNGNVFTGAPGHPGILDTNDFTWGTVPPPAQWRDAAGAVLVPDGPDGSTSVMQVGGVSYTEPQVDGASLATATGEVFDTENPGLGWQTAPSYEIPRSTANVVQLPDGSMVSVGGGRGWNAAQGLYLTDAGGIRKQIEIFDPEAGDWRLGPAQVEDRAYHSTAVLLPDGRVMSAGDDFHPSGAGGAFSETDTAEIYSPPYLFNGSRPEIDDVPASVRWKEPFTVASASAGLERAVLMAPAATTHANDMQQRHVELRVLGTADGGGLNVEAPPSGGVAPPGPYMLFLLNADGVPSVARWVNVLPEASVPGPPLGVRGKITSGKRLLRRKGRVTANVWASEAGTFMARLELRRPGSRKWVSAKGPGPTSLAAAGTRTVSFRAPRSVRYAKGKVLARLTLTAKDGDGDVAEDRRKFALRR